MRLQTRLILVFLFLAAIPVAVSGYTILTILDVNIRDQRDQVLSDRVKLLGLRVEDNLSQAADGLALSLEALDINQIETADRVAYLRILYRQRPWLNFVQLLDSQGAEIAPPVFLADPRLLVGTLEPHLAIASSTANQIIDPTLLSLARGSTERALWGTPQVFSPGQPAQIPLVVVCRPEARPPFFAYTLVNLPLASGVERVFDQFAHSLNPRFSTGIYLLDSQLEILFKREVGQSQRADLASVQKMRDDLNAQRTQYQIHIDNKDHVVNTHPLSLGEMRVLTLQHASEVYQVEEDYRARFKYWTAVSCIIAVVFGAYFARTLSNPIRTLANAVLGVARGDLDTRVKVNTGGEIGELADTFNLMAKALKEQKAEIERQNQEINNWNRELQARVDARTRELKEAQGYLVHSQKLAAVAELGSGVAHELNNPLAAVLGFTQILMARHTQLGPDGQPIDDPELKILRKIEEQSQRCRNIVEHLLRFSQEQVDRGAYEDLDLGDVVSNVIKLFEGSFAAQRVRVTSQIPSGELVIHGNRAQLLQAFLQLFHAIRPMLRAGHELVVERKQGSTEVQLVFVGPMDGLDNPALDLFQRRQNQDQAMAQGLGLWLAHQIIQEHRGSLQVEAPEVSNEEAPRLVITLPRSLPQPSGGSGGSTEPASGALSGGTG